MSNAPKSVLKAGFNRSRIVLALYADKLAKPSQPKVVTLCQFCAVTGFEIDSLTALGGEIADKAHCADCGAAATTVVAVEAN